MATLTVNGTEQTFTAEAFPATLSALLQSLNLDPAAVVAEVDGEIVPRNEFGSRALSDGQTIELVQFVGGG